MKYNGNNHKIGDVLIKPILTAKSASLEILQQKITFYVAKWANKKTISLAIKKCFSAKVEFVNIINEKTKKRVFKGKSFLLKTGKKAIITLKKGSFINLGGFDL